MTSDAKAVGDMRVYVGTYTRSGSKGVYLCFFDPGSGKLSKAQLACEATDPSFIAVHPNSRFLYAVSAMPAGEDAYGCVSAFAVCANTGRLTALNHVSSGGANPCHVSVDKTGKCALVANYGSGSVGAFGILPDGRLTQATDVIQHRGASLDAARQEGPHAHSVTVDAANRFAFAADLGLDKILIYRLNASKATLEPNEPSSVSVEGGSGPRHFAFHPCGHYAYVINEMANTITVFGYDFEKGALSEIQTVATVPTGFREQTYTAEIQVDQAGRFLYASNRGHESIAVFAIDLNTGTLSLVDIRCCGGKWPRHFHIDPTGKWLLVANERSDSITVFARDPSSGKLTATGEAVSICAPVCIKFLS